MSKQSDYIAYLKQGMMARGLPEHVADGFLMNFRDESGFNPSVNEANPIVAGSRGGRGLYQLTGDRRNQYEAYNSQTGGAPYGTDSQLDFMMKELNGPEKAAAQKIMNTSTPQEAAVAIVKNFLRPAAEHQASRTAKYMSGGDPYAGISGPGMDTKPQMQFPETPQTPAQMAMEPMANSSAPKTPAAPMQPVKPATADNTGAGVSLGGLFSNLGKAFAAPMQATTGGGAHVQVLKNDQGGAQQSAAEGAQDATAIAQSAPGVGFDVNALLSAGLDPTAAAGGVPAWKLRKPKVFGQDDQA